MNYACLLCFVSAQQRAGEIVSLLQNQLNINITSKELQVMNSIEVTVVSRKLDEKQKDASYKCFVVDMNCKLTEKVVHCGLKCPINQEGGAQWRAPASSLLPSPAKQKPLGGIECQCVVGVFGIREKGELEEMRKRSELLDI
uniref:Uncharacterized protein n=2 Tax=Oryza TaxID=4527 RepID=A0A679BCS2_9ORYZ|nr:hypothetical protein [Oryza barthii]BBF89503.1 hypothetical protein [Oryza glaberrima]